MNLFFSCKKHNYSSQNILTNYENSKKNKEKKSIKNKEKEDNKGKEQLLLLNNDSNDSFNNLEIIDYPYSINNNKDDATEEMNSPYKYKEAQNLVNQITNEISSNLLYEGQENKNQRQRNFNFYQNSSDTSSGIIKNENSVQKNKTLLNNYYNLIKLNNVNKVSKFPNSKKEKNNLSDKMNIAKIKVTDDISEEKFECPCPPCPDNQDLNKLLNKSKTKFFKTISILSDISKKKVQKNNLIKIKNNRVVKKNKTIESQGKNKEKFKFKKVIEINDSYVGNRGNISKDNSKIYNTRCVYVNKSDNNIKEYKVYKGKLKNIMTKKMECQTINVIKKGKILNKNNTNRTIQFLEQIKKKGKAIKYIKNIVKSKPMYSSNTNFKSSLINRMNKEIDTIKKTFSKMENKRIVKKQIKNKKENNKIINKKLNLNPFTTDEKHLKK